MAEVDQIAAYIPQGKYKELSKQQWESFQDSIFRTHQKRLDKIFKKYGLQHILEKMKIEVDNDNAEASAYGLLVDRVNLNKGRPQIYGTQVTYNTEICQAYPKNLADSASVNERRKSIGLPPIEEYLNQMTQMPFDMNKENYLSRGIKAPKLCKTK
jgi:hypothetical protein